jgi:D-alanyl-D-alanine carboxypeptidase
MNHNLLRYFLNIKVDQAAITDRVRAGKLLRWAAMRIVGRSIRILVFFAAVILAGASERSAFAAQYAAIVMDMRDGTVLHESNPDRRQAPASLTKMMTLYLAFEAVENGQLRLNQKVRISRHAARQPPSKLYLKTGQRVSIQSLIRASAIKSANDAATALAEAVGGTEKAFARLMTAKARQLGMINTTFKNASGLTARGHVSTARDMAILGRHLFFDFPQYYNLFSRRKTYAAGKRIRSHNRLLASYRGADGIKTGYTHAAGYTLVASAHRGNKRIIAALLGGKSSRWRNARMVNLLDKGFARTATRVAMVAPHLRRPAVVRAPLPRAKPGTPATGLALLAQALTTQAVASTPPSTSRLAPLYAVMPPQRPIANTADAGGVNQADQNPLPVPRPNRSAQLGGPEKRAVEVAQSANATPSEIEMLANAAPVIDLIRGRGVAPIYQVRFIGLAPGYASRACQTFTTNRNDCAALALGI